MKVGNRQAFITRLAPLPLGNGAFLCPLVSALFDVIVKSMTDKLNSQRFYILDPIRFLAAIAVVCFHYLFRGWAADDLSPLEFPEISGVAKYGYLGVQLFFLISGFVIFMSAYGKSPSQFVASRIARLYPAYWFSVIFTSVFIILLGGSDYSITGVQFLSNLTMMQEFFGQAHVDGVYWTLTCELVFYFWIWLLLMKKKEKFFEYFSVFFLLMSIASNNVDLPSVVHTWLLLEYSPYFISGAIFFQIYQRGMAVVRVAVLTLAFILAQYQAYVQSGEMIVHYAANFTAFHVGSIVSMMFVFFSLLIAGVFNKFKAPWVVGLGSLTYPLYLIHQNFGYIIFNQLGTDNNKYCVLIFVLLLCLLGSYFINNFIEQRFAVVLRAGCYKAFNLS